MWLYISYIFFYWLTWPQQVAVEDYKWNPAINYRHNAAGNWELEGEMRQGIRSKWCLTATLKGLCVRTLFLFNMHMHVCGYKQNREDRGLNNPQGTKILGPHDPSSGWGPAVLYEACTGWRIEPHKKSGEKRDHLQCPTVSVWWRQIFRIRLSKASQNKQKNNL